MAGLAVELLVSPRQFISGKFVVEATDIKTDNFKIASVMITMTGKTILPGDVRRGMISFLLVDPAFDFFMTFEAFVI